MSQCNTISLVKQLWHLVLILSKIVDLSQGIHPLKSSIELQNNSDILLTIIMKLIMDYRDIIIKSKKPLQ